MPFGVHKGVPLNAIPTSYLRWLVGLGDLRHPLKAAVAEEARRRGFFGNAHQHRPADPPRPRARYSPDPALVEELINAGHRALARRYHPDAGGAHEQMVAVNNTADWVLLQLRGLSA